MVLPEENPIYGPFFGVMGAASAIIFSCKLDDEKKIIDLLRVGFHAVREPQYGSIRCPFAGAFFAKAARNRA